MQGKEQGQQTSQGPQLSQASIIPPKQDGGLLEGIGNFAKTAISGTKIGRNIAAVQSQDLQNDLDTFKTMMQNPTANPQDLQALGSKIIANNPRLAEIGQKMSFVAGQQKAKTEDPYEQVSKLSTGLKNLVDAGITGPIVDSLTNKIAEVGGLVTGEGILTPKKEKPTTVSPGGSVYENGQFFTAPEKTPQPQNTVVPAGSKVLRDGKWVEGGPVKSEQGFTLNEGQKRYDAQGNEIASGPQKSPTTKNTTLGLGQTLVDEKGNRLGGTNLKGEYKSNQDLISDNFVGPMPADVKTDNRGLFSTQANKAGKLSSVTNDAPPLESYFQASTPMVPTENIPQTYEQSGITQPDEQQSLQEMQQVVPDVNLTQEYQDDPESMKEIMKLRKQGKMPDKLLRQLFIKKQAQQTLGITK